MGRVFERLRSLLGRPGRRAPILIVLVSVASVLQSLAHGIAADDVWHKLAFTGAGSDWARHKNPWWNQFAFFDGTAERAHWLMNVGIAPWWSDVSVRAVFFRPLSSATHAVDWTLWPRMPWLMHAHSIAWYAALVTAATWAYRLLLAPAGDGRKAGDGDGVWVARLAALLYGLDHTHGLPVAWLANRNAIIAGTFALASLGAHVAAAREASNARRRRLAAASALALALALASGESALAVVAYLGAHAVVLDARPRASRVTSLLPHAAVVVAWAAVYRLGGFGVRESGVYIEPLRDPDRFLAAAAVHLPMLLATGLGAPPPDVYAFVPTPAKIALLTFALLFLAWSSVVLVRLWRESAMARLFLAGSIGALLPACAIFPSARLLVTPSFGLIGLVALVFARMVDDPGWLVCRGGRLVRALARSFAVFTSLGHLVLSPLAMQLTVAQMWLLDNVVHRLARGFPATEPPPSRLVVMNAPDTVFMAFVLVDAKLAPRPSPDRMLTVAGGQRDLAITRDGERSLLVTQADGFYRTGTELILRKASAPMPEGTRVALDGVTVEVVGTLADGVPHRARFTFESPLDGPHLAFRRWDGRGLVPFTPPPLGETVLIAGRLPAPY